MASNLDSQDYPLDIREQLARIDQIHADIGQKLVGTDRTRQETRFAPIVLVFTGMGAATAFFAAGVAFAKVFIN